MEVIVIKFMALKETIDLDIVIIVKVMDSVTFVIVIIVIDNIISTLVIDNT